MQRNNYSAGSKFFSSEEIFFYQPVGFFLGRRQAET